jgi:hypothetical protein
MFSTVLAIHYIIYLLKQSHYRLGQTLRVTGVLRLPDFKTIGTGIL